MFSSSSASPVSSETSATTDSSVLRSSRKRCHAARDAYAECVDASGTPPSARGTAQGLVVPPQCATLRAAFEQSCKKSWVDHFDLLRVKEKDLARRIQDSIKKNSDKGKKAGSLAGERQG